MPSAPLAPISQSRKKQRTRHHTETSVSFDENKENDAPGFLPHPHLKTHHPVPEKEDDLPPIPFPLPATPANRISLDDLVGNTEDAFNRPAVATTPNDCVTWQHGPRSSDPASSYHTTQRSRKRARSSSPSSSQLEKLNHFSAQKDSLNLESMQKSLRTPQNDPAVELWNRYASGNGSKSIRQDSGVPGLAHMMPSSPQTPSTTDSREKSLRRVVSCGVQWPTTETKKRRTPPKSYSRVKNMFAASKKQILAHEMPKSGRVSLLLDRIQESLTKKPLDEVEDDAEGPSSSSPMPDEHSDLGILLNALPLDLPPPLHAAIAQNEERLNDATEHPQMPERSPFKNDSSSDYGGDEIDYELFEQVDFAATQAMAGAGIQKSPSKLEKKALKENIAPPKPPWTTCQAQVQQPSKTWISRNPEEPKLPKQVEEARRTAGVGEKDELSDDEYGLDDPDFASELEDLAVQVESQEKQYATIQPAVAVSEIAPQTTEKLPGVQVHVADEFDDPLDDEDWQDLAEGSIALQSASGVGSRSQVCGPR
jgi:hypothetical protein